jgi:hypothetical protein
MRSYLPPPRPPLQKKSQKRAGGVAQDVGPEFKPQYHTHKKKAKYTLFVYLLKSYQNCIRNIMNLEKNLKEQ